MPTRANPLYIAPPCPITAAPTLPVPATFLPWSPTGGNPSCATPPIRNALRHAIETARAARPFVIDAWVLLPDHLHCVWTLPEGDADFSTRWAIIKRSVTLACAEYRRDEWMNPSKTKHRESTIWQRRFWEHQIRDENDYARHIDYIHHNPVKHGHAQRPIDWPYSTLHRYVREGIYPADWASTTNAEIKGEA